MIEFKDVKPNFTTQQKLDSKPYSEILELIASLVGAENFAKGKILSYPAATTDDVVNIIFNTIKEVYFDGFLSSENNLKFSSIKSELINFLNANEKNNLEKLLSCLVGSTITMYRTFYEKNNNNTN